MGEAVLMHRVLVIDSDPAMSRALCINLQARQYEARAAATGCDGLVLAGRYDADAVLVDFDLTDMSGLDVIAGLRGWSSVPIIVTSQRNAVLDTISALDAGADDYVTKPFAMGEVLARLRALLRRSVQTEEPVSIATEDFTIDLVAKRVTTAVGEMHLSPIEWRLVEVLVRNVGKVVTQTTLLREVWGPSCPTTKTQYLRVTIQRVRNKLEPIPCQPRYFLTHPGLGLRFSDDDVRPDMEGAEPCNEECRPSGERSGPPMAAFGRSRQTDTHRADGSLVLVR